MTFSYEALGEARKMNAQQTAAAIRAALERGDQKTARLLFNKYVHGGELGDPGYWGYDTRRADVRGTKLYNLGIRIRGVTVELF